MTKSRRGRRRSWPWWPREYVSVLSALHTAELALAIREAEAKRTRRVLGEVREELTREDPDE